MISMIRSLQLDVIYGEKLELNVVADRETIKRLRQLIKASIHNISEEHTYKLSITNSQKSHGEQN